MAKEEIQSIRYGFSGGFQGRDSSTTKDQRLVNLYQETVEGRKLLVKRPGLVLYSTLPEGEGRGIFSFNGHVWSVVGSKLYRGTNEVLTLTTTTGHIGFTKCTASGLARMFFCDGTKGYIIDTTNTITEITDVDFPTPHIPTPVFMDGYVCLIRANSADIYNCDLDTPSSWTASNFVTSELFPDGVTALAVQNNQIVAFGETGTEFFYNNGAQQTTGTPLARNNSTFLQMGSAAPYAIGQNEKFCFFISQSQSGGRAVWQLNGFEPIQVSTNSIERVLDAEGTDITSTTSALLRLAGHFFFVIFLSTRTLVYDVDEKVWHEWTSTNQSTILNSQINGQVINGLVINGNDGSNSIFNTEEFLYNHIVDIGDGQVYALHKSLGVLAKFSTSSYKDIDQIIRCEVNTPILDFGSYKRKFLHRLTVVGDLASNDIFLKWSDNDYQTWSNLKQLHMASRPVFHRLGAFRRRAFNIYYTDNYPLRLEGLEFTLTEGET